MNLTFETMGPQDADVFVTVAAPAFSSYAFFTHYLPDGPGRARCIEDMIGCNYRANQGRGAFLLARADGEPVAVAQLHDLTAPEPSNWRYLAAGYWKVFLRTGARNAIDWRLMDMDAMRPCLERPEGAWFLDVLAVAPQWEGKGIGSRMLRECVVPFAREQGARELRLYTNAQINRRFYQKCGFEEFDEQSFSRRGHEIGSWSYRMSL